MAKETTIQTSGKSNDYTVRVINSSRKLTPKEQVSLCYNNLDYVKLNKASEVEPVILEVDWWAVTEIHNESSQDKDYNNYILFDKEGVGYVTGSESFWRQFSGIWDIMGQQENPEPWQLKIFQSKSKKREGKTFITCAIV